MDRDLNWQNKVSSAQKNQSSYPPLKYMRRTSIVIPQMKRGTMYGLVPFKGMPDYVPYRRSSRDKLGVPPSTRGYRVSTSWKYSSEYSIAKGKFWYGGYIDDNFGHFITETITRVWWYLQNYPNDYTAVFVPNPKSGKLTSWQREILAYFKIENPVLVEKPTEFEQLVIPQQGALLFSDVHEPTYLQTLSDWNTRVQGKRRIGGKVYLSRLSASRANVIGEAKLAQCFADAGYTVIEPESLPIEEQLGILRGATHVAGTQGSAFHIFNLLGHSPANVLMFQRLGTLTGEKMAETLAPYVTSVSTVPAAVRFSVDTGTYNDVTLLDAVALQNQVHDFDPDVDLDPYLSDPTLKQVGSGFAPDPGGINQYVLAQTARSTMGRAAQLVDATEKKARRTLISCYRHMFRI